MTTSQETLPKRHSDLLTYGVQMLSHLKSGKLDPADVGLRAADVAELDSLVSEHQTRLAKADQLRNSLKGATRALSGRKGSHARLAAKLRQCANKARYSSAPSNVLARLNVKRKKVRGTRRNAPDTAPAFTLDHVVAGWIHLRFRTNGSASPRARAKNATGVHVAVVDDATPIASGEADQVPIKILTRSPAYLPTMGWPARVRLYARWFTQRGETSGWSTPLLVTVL